MEYDNVNHPKHYMEGPVTRLIECIDITRYLPFSLGNAIKYVWRAGSKGDTDKALEDLDKALWYLDDWADMMDGLPTPVRDVYLAQVAYVAPIVKLLSGDDQTIEEDVIKAAFIRNLIENPEPNGVEALQIQRLKEIYQKAQDMGAEDE